MSITDQVAKIQGLFVYFPSSFVHLTMAPKAEPFPLGSIPRYHAVRKFAPAAHCAGSDIITSTVRTWSEAV